MKIKLQDLEYNKSARQLVTFSIPGRCPEKITVIGQTREVEFVYSKENAIANEFWDGEYTVMYSTNIEPPMTLVVF